MSIVENVREIVENRMEHSSSHDWEHVNRVFLLATRIAEEMEADLEIVQLGALLHDIGRTVGEPHNITGVSKTREILEAFRYDTTRLKEIENIVKNHNMDNWSKLSTIEEKIVWDADKLDGLGAIGIARAFYMRGECGYPFHDFNWFKEDTMFRFDRLNTDAAMKIGYERIKFMKQFFNQLSCELVE